MKVAEEINIPVHSGKKEKYEILIPQIRALVEGEPDNIANLCNIVAALKYGLDFFWVGIYLVKEGQKGEELVLGPFQGPVACTRIAKGKGVCGKAWESDQTILVPDVEKFPGHIACSSLSRSEIVVPLRKNAKVTGVLDVDSTKLSDFDEVDAFYLEQVCQIVSGVI